MAKKQNRGTSVPGSTRQPIPGATREGPVAGDEIVDVTIRLREGQKSKAERVYRERARGTAKDEPLTRQELAQQVGARPEDAQLVEAFAHEHGLTVLSIDLPQRTVQLRGPAEAMQKAFSVSLERVSARGQSFRQRTGSVHVPDALSEVITGVFGLDDRPQAKPHFRVQLNPAGAVATHAATAPFTPPELARIYDFPPKTDGKGQCIALIELGGGFAQSDQASREADFAHGHDHRVGRFARETQEPDAVRNAARGSGNLDGVGHAAKVLGKQVDQLRGAAEIVHRKQHARRKVISSERMPGEFAQRFNFEVAPQTARLPWLTAPPPPWKARKSGAPPPGPARKHP